MKDFNSIPLKIQAFILKGKLELILGKYHTFETFFVEAQKLAKEYELEIAEAWIQAELLKLKKELDKWDNYFKNNTPIKDRIQAAEMENYINELKKMLVNK